MGGDCNLSLSQFQMFYAVASMSRWNIESMIPWLQGGTMLQNSSTRFKAAVSYRWRFEAVDRAAGRVKKKKSLGKNQWRPSIKCQRGQICRSVAALHSFHFQSISFYVWFIFVAIDIPCAFEVLLFHRFFSTLTSFAVHPLTQVAPIGCYWGKAAKHKQVITSV